LETIAEGTFAALSATNEAILYAKSPEGLYRKVCEAAFSSGDFLATAVFLLDEKTGLLRLATGFGDDIARLRSIEISTVAGTPEGSGVCGQAFRDQELCISNDFLNDARSLAWRQGAETGHVGAAAALPLICNGRSIGVLMVTKREAGSLTDQVVSMLKRMSANISYALDNFAREEARQDGERTVHRLNRMFGAISATNEAILRAKSAPELYQLVCDGAVYSGKSLATVVFLTEPHSTWLRPVAGSGESFELIKRARFSIDPENPYGQGVCGQAFRTQRPCVNNDIQNSEQGRPWREAGHETGVVACVAVPLVKAGVSVGVLMVFMTKSWADDEEVIALLARMAENVSFALENFDRAAEKVRIAREEERLTRMFAALSATNEAIMRATSRAELFDLVCDAALVGGDFTSTTIALHRPGAKFLENVAAAGPDRVRAIEVNISADPNLPEGRGITGIAFRSRRPCISNDYLADFGVDGHFSAGVRDSGTRSGAALPLLKGDEAIGAIVILSRELNAFSPELIALLERLAKNVSFGLDNFDRADEKAKADEQKERLARMFAALSATNEAIMRAKSRAELYELVCAAAASGAKFTSTSIALAREGSHELDIVAASGPTAATMRKVTLSAVETRPEGQGLCGRAFRSRQACIANDYLVDPRNRAFYAKAIGDGAKSGAAFPLIAGGRAVGTMLFVAIEKDTFTPEFVELLQRLADNVAFALENFDRADEKERADERIEYLASHDSLTGLPNREMFNGLLRHAIDMAERYERRFALLFIDLDRFKVINDSLGHDAGDSLLAEVAHRLRAALRASDVVARLGGDEFVVILEEAADVADVERVAAQLLSVLSQPLQLSGHECHTTASIGIAMYPSNGSDLQTLTRNADMAMYLAKEDGKNGFRFFSREIKAQSIERLTLESALRRAAERNQFALHYQPKVDIESGQITGVEALLRWNHPDFGMVPPAQFIPLAEETGLIVPIGRWVLQEACAQNMAWQRRGLLPVTMAVNLSPRQFADPHLLADIDLALFSSGMSPVLLQLEVTESMVMRNVARAVKVLDAIQSRGIRLAIDDFGTGYSSMSLMKQFPIDTIKIDRSFVRDLPQDTEDCAIAEAIISMGKALGMTIVAEGVETADQQAFLREHACDEMQGFLFSKPVTAQQMTVLLRSPPRLASPPLQPDADGSPDAIADELKDAGA
jgi:diguanylate cyclase (GGDEF)-like protein